MHSCQQSIEFAFSPNTPPENLVAKTDTIIPKCKSVISKEIMKLSCLNNECSSLDFHKSGISALCTLYSKVLAEAMTAEKCCKRQPTGGVWSKANIS
jgi:hypothetical protein